MGLGNGCLFAPTMTVVSTYFARRRYFAMGLVATGSATGGLVFPSMARQLLPSAGFPWTMRAIGFVQLASLVVANTFLRPRIPPRRTGPLVEWAAFRELEYTFYAAGSFFVSVPLSFSPLSPLSSFSDSKQKQIFLGVYFAFYYLASFSRDIIHMSYTDSLNLILVINGMGVLGRLGPNLLADRVGPINVFIPTAMVAGVCVFCWLAVRDVAGMYVWTVFYGIAGGGIQSLFPAGLSSLTPDLRRAGVRMGMVFTINSFAVLAGPPIAGRLVTAAGGSYVGAQGFAGAALLVGTGFLVAARVVKGRRLGGGWAVKV